MGVGLALGAASGLLALGYLGLLERFDVSLPTAELPDPSLLARVVSALAVVLAAPVAEAIFFRGWLQDAIRADLHRFPKITAVVLAAVAFACVHPPASFLPVLVLGLVAGWLYERSGALLVAIAAHLAHNAVVVWSRV